MTTLTTAAWHGRNPRSGFRIARGENVGRVKKGKLTRCDPVRTTAPHATKAIITNELQQDGSPTFCCLCCVRALLLVCPISHSRREGGKERENQNQKRKHSANPGHERHRGRGTTGGLVGICGVPAPRCIIFTPSKLLRSLAVPVSSPHFPLSVQATARRRDLTQSAFVCAHRSRIVGKAR